MKKKAAEKVTEKVSKTVKNTGKTAKRTVKKARKKMSKEERERREVERFRELINQPRAGLRRDIMEPREVEPVKLRGIGLSDVLYLSPGDLKPNPLNEKLFRKESEDYFGKLADDIGERGVIVPLIAKMDGTLLAGHNRLLVALQLGMENIPVQKVTDQLTEEKETEFLIKDNYLRRHLTAAEKEWVIRKLYGEEIMKDRRGGDRKSENARIKGSTEPLMGENAGIKSSTEPLISEPQNLAKRIEQEIGIKAGTAKRIIADIRKEGDKEMEQRELTDEERQQGQPIALEVETLRERRAELESELRDVKKRERVRLKELKTIGEPSLFGIF